MRRAEKKIADPGVVEELLRTAQVGRLGTFGRDGYPMVKPLNFVYDGGAIFFHTALAGEKIDDLTQCERVCFEVDVAIGYVRSKDQPCQADYLFRSVIVRGRARLVEGGAEKRLALEALMEKYQGPGEYPFPADKLRATGVVRIDVEEMVGKEHLREGVLRKAAEEALATGLQTPRVFDRG